MYLSLPPAYSAAIHDLNSAVRLGEYVVVALLICLLNAARSAAQERAEMARAEAETANRAKDQFLAMVSHELRTPLNSILGWAKLLRSGKLAESESTRGLEVIERNTRTQAQLIEELLDVSRIVTGKLHIQMSYLELAPIIEAAIDTVRPAAHAKAIQLQTVLDSLPSPVRGDRERLQQVIWNLLSNAVKFTPDGGRIEVRLKGLEDLAEIIVKDTGMGISPNTVHLTDKMRYPVVNFHRRTAYGT